MSNKRSKRYEKAAALVEEGKTYSLDEAAALLDGSRLRRSPARHW